MRNVTILALTLLCCLLAASGRAQTVAGLPDTNPWSMRHADMARTGQSDWPGPDLGEIDWKWQTAGSTPGFAVGRNFKIYSGVAFNGETWSGESYFTTFEPRGEISWRRRVVPYEWGFDQGVDSAPAIDSQGNIVFNSTKSQLIKSDRAGRPIFSVQRRDGASNDSAPAILADGSILHYQYFDGGLAKYSPDGTLLWQKLLDSESAVAVSPNGDIAMGGLRSIEPHGATDITYLNSEGTILWDRESTWGTDGQAVFGPDGTLYQGVGAYNPDGSVKWGSPGGGVVALGKNGQHYANGFSSIDARDAQTGALLWSTAIPGEMGVPLDGFAIDGRGMIYVTTYNGYLVGLHPVAGDIFLAAKICDEFKTSPVIAAGRRIVAAGGESAVGNFIYQIR